MIPGMSPWELVDGAVVIAVVGEVAVVVEAGFEVVAAVAVDNVVWLS
jgi:hypothetical protein